MYTNNDYKIGTEHTQKATKTGLQPTRFLFRHGWASVCRSLARAIIAF